MDGLTASAPFVAGVDPGVDPGIDERRLDPRYLVKEDAFMWDLLRIKAGYHSVNIIDLSRNGLRLEASSEVPEGSQVAVDFRGMIVCGTIRYCETAGDRFAMGVQIDDVLDPLRGSMASH